MRDLEQCRAEVFRRSEEKIKENKRMRRRALTLCLPLALCLVIGAVTAPVLLREGNKSANAPTPVINSLPRESGKEEDAATAPEAARFESDAAEKLLRALAPPVDIACEQPKDSNAVDMTNEQRADDDKVKYGTGAFRFVLVTPEGEETYVLSDGVLTCETGNWQRTLTPDEEDDLLAALGLPAEESRK